MARRLMLFFTGAIIGSFFAYFTLIKDKGRDFSGYFPNSRVLKKLNVGLDTTNSNFLCYTNCFDLSNKDFRVMLLEGEVDFENSETQKANKSYLVQSSYKGLDYLMNFTLVDSTAALTTLHCIDLEKDCPCN